MRILQICNKPPFPAVDGGAIAMNNVTQGLINKGCSIHVLTITTPKHNVNINELPKSYVEKTNFQSVYIDTSIKIKDAFLNLFSKRSYNIDRFINDFIFIIASTCCKNRLMFQNPYKFFAFIFID